MADPNQTLRDRLQGLNLYLVGMMGVGKSTLGKAIAQALNYQFFDTDVLIEQVAQRSIPDIFAQDGEAGFRTLETQVLAQLCPYHHLVVATGGGMVTQSENWSYLQQGLVIWLDLPAEEIYQRLKRDPTPRPLLQTPDPQGKLQELLLARQDLYAQADLRFQNHRWDEAIPDLCDRLLRAIPSVLKPEEARS